MQKQQQQIDIEKKQIFLRNQILQGGLDAESFMDYMGTIKRQAENIDLNQWTMKQLDDVVKDFKNQIKADAETLKKVQQSNFRQSRDLMAKILSTSIMKKQKVFWDKGVWDYQLFNEQQCKKINKVFDFSPLIKPKISISKWEVRSHGGFFLGFGATKQLWFTISTNFTAKPIQRTNSDIQWYRNALVKLSPGSFIPPLSELRNVEPQDKKSLVNRAKLIEQFLNSLLKYELIQSSISKVFLTQMDHNKFTNFKNTQKSINYQRNIGRVQTLDGKFELEISQRSQKFIKNCSAFGKVAQQVYQDVDGQVNKILSDMQTLSKHVLYISNSCGVLHQKYAKISSLNEIKESSMQTIMIYLNNIFSNIGKNIKEHMNVIKEFSDDFIQCSIRSWQQFLLHDKRYQRELDNYLSFKTQLAKKKQRFSADFTKWELQSQADYKRIARLDLTSISKDQIFQMMFPKDNKQEQQLRIWLSYINNVYQTSFKTFLKDEESQIKEKFNLFIDHSQKVSDQNNHAVKQFRQILANSS